MEQVTNTIRRGKVMFFDDRHGFGFIRMKGTRQDFYVRYSEIDSEDQRKSLQKGQIVEFKAIEGKKGPAATNVRVVTQ